MRSTKRVGLIVAVLALWAIAALGYSGSGAVVAMKNGDFIVKYFNGTQQGIDSAVVYCTGPGGTIQLGPGLESLKPTSPPPVNVTVYRTGSKGWEISGGSATFTGPRLGPASAVTTGGALRIVDGVTFPLTAAGIQAAIGDLPNRGGTVIVSADSIPFGSSTLSITKNYVTLQGAGGRAAVFTYSGSGRFLQLGTDDGNHSGAAAYNGQASGIKIRGIRLAGPGKGSTATAITDWDSGSNSFEDLTVDGWGTGYYGIGADVSQFKGNLWSNNGTAVYLASRCDQNTFYSDYFTQNKYAIYNEWAYGMRVYGCQFVFSDSADIVYDVTASTTNGGDTRSGGQRALISGSWFENLSAGSPPRHLQLGVNGTSARVLLGMTLIGNEWFSANTDTFVSVQAFGDVDLYGNGTSGVAATFVRVNPVSGWAPVIHNLMNATSSAIIPLAGAGDTTSVYRLEPAYQNSGWTFKGNARIGPTTFGALGTPLNGTIIYCSDCTIANPCAGSGTGALAKRLNGIWVCN